MTLRKEGQEKILRESLPKIKNFAKGEPLAITLPLLTPCIPEYSRYMAKELASTLFTAIGTCDMTKASPCFDFILALFDAADQSKPQSLPFEPLIGHRDSLSSLFRHTKNVELRVFRIITRLLQADPIRVVTWVKKHPRDLRPLCELVAESQSVDAGNFLHHLAVSNPEILPKISGFIKPLLSRYPVSTVIDFMVASNEMRDLMLQANFGRWLLDHEQFTVSDVEIVTKYDPQSWQNQTAAQMFVNSLPASKMKDFDWMKSRPPADFELNRPILLKCIEGIKSAGSAAETFLFCRFFVISLAHPSGVPPDIQTIIGNAIASPIDHLSAAAMQCFAIWAFKFEHTPPPNVICQVAAIATIPRDGRSAFAMLAKSVLYPCAKSSGLAATIIQNDENCRFTEEDVRFVRREAWVFSHYAVHLAALPRIKIDDYNSALHVLGCVLEYLQVDDVSALER
jgi:hypothetical protein